MTGTEPPSIAASGHLPVVLDDRRRARAFALGCVAVIAGVLLHLPMFWMGHANGFRLAGMPMDAGMTFGMLAIIAGIALAAWGLLPPRVSGRVDTVFTVPDDLPLGRAQRRLMMALVIALIIDVMKPASLGFVLPGMRREYGLDAPGVALLPFAALSGTVAGSILWGLLADRYGRRATILLSAVIFVGTSICGAMPSFAWNLGMCFLMGAAAGGMLPVAYALLTETLPARHRGWALVLVGGAGSAGGYLAASGLASWLEPILSWRILWFLNLPSGLILILLNPLIPESPGFLWRMGRFEQARATLASFGAVLRDATVEPRHTSASHGPGLSGLTLALSMSAIAWGFVNFGVLLWMPANLVARGYSMAGSSALLAASALLALPTVALVAGLYGRWSSRGSLLAAIVLTGAGLAGVILLDNGMRSVLGPIACMTLLIIGCNALIAILLPYAAESYPLAIRGRATGWIAACTKVGGLGAQILGVAGIVPALGPAAAGIAVPVLVSLGLAAKYCRETRGRSLDNG